MRLAPNDFTRMFNETWLPQLAGCPNLYVQGIGKLGEPIPIQVSLFGPDLTQPNVLVYAWTEATHIRVCRSIDGAIWGDAPHRPSSPPPDPHRISDGPRRTILRSYVEQIPDSDHLAYGRELARRLVIRRQDDIDSVARQIGELREAVERMGTDLTRARMLETAWNADGPSVRTIACSLIAAELRCSADELIDTAEHLARPED